MFKSKKNIQCFILNTTEECNMNQNVIQLLLETSHNMFTLSVTVKKIPFMSERARKISNKNSNCHKMADIFDASYQYKKHLELLYFITIILFEIY